LQSYTDASINSLQSTVTSSYQSYTDAAIDAIPQNGFQWQASEDGTKRISTGFLENDIDYVVRSVSINDNKLEVELATFTPIHIHSLNNILAWDEPATGFTISVDNPSDFTSKYIASAGAINTYGQGGTFSTHVHDYGTTGKSATPGGGVDWSQTFTVTDTGVIYPNVNGTESANNDPFGGVALATIDSIDESGNIFGNWGVEFEWEDASASINFANLSGNTFLQSYNTIGYTVTDNMSNSDNVVHQVSALTVGTISNTNGSGTLTFNNPIHKDNNFGRGITLFSEFTRPASVTGTSYVINLQNNDNTINASFTYPSFSLWTTDVATVPTVTDIVSGSSYAGGVTTLGNESKTIATTINNTASVPRVYWFGVRASANQPTTFQTGPSSALLVDVAYVESFVELNPDSTPVGYINELYKLYGITLQPGNTYVRIA
jgi:hypothetical protein